MSVNAISQISYGSSNTSGSCSGLSEETKKKLIALGINPANVTSEAQAKILIENASKQQGIKSNSKCSCAGESELISRAKALALKIGAKISDTMSLEEILEVISQKIESDNLEEYKAEAEALGCEISNLKQTENAMYASMNYNADLNKIMLGL